MSRKSKLKKEIKTCQKTIVEIERRRARSQSALVQAILLQEEPNEADVEWFNKYTGEITACRNHMLEMNVKSTQKRFEILRKSLINLNKLLANINISLYN